MVTVLSKTDGSIGRVKKEQPLNALIPVDLDYYETAEEHERIKDALIEHANALNSGSGPLFELDTATTDGWASPEWIRTEADTPSSPAGTGPTLSVVARPDMPSLSALRFAANVRGGYVWRVPGLTLPTTGYVLEVDVCGYASDTWVAGIMPICTAADPVAGLSFSQRRTAANFYTHEVGLETTDYSRPAPLTNPAIGYTPSAVKLQAGPLRLSWTVRRAPDVLPPEWQIRFAAEGTDEAVGVANFSNVAPWGPVSSLDNATFDAVGIFVLVDSGGAADVSIDIAGLRVRAL